MVIHECGNGILSSRSRAVSMFLRGFIGCVTLFLQPAFRPAFRDVPHPCVVFLAAWFERREGV